MENSSKKKVQSGKPEKDRVPAIYKELIEKCKANSLDVFIIPAVLNQKPKHGQTWNTYLMDRESTSVNSSENFDESITVYVAFSNFDKSGAPHKIFIKNAKTSTNFIDTLCTVLFKYEYITTLKLMDCSLTRQAIEILHTHLIDMPNITEITLDGNPISAQNHGILAICETLENFSLKRCKINDVGVENLYQNLTKCQQPKLKVLNLTGNYIDDTAAIALEKLLRENRSISVLILADNWITDAGCYSIMSALQSFSLNTIETTKRRTITINYFRQKIKMTEEIKKDKQIVKVSPTPPPSAKSKKSAKTKKKEVGRKSTIHNEMHKQVSEYVENILPKISHPFICETENINRELICSGNSALGFINLGYNKLTNKSYKYIIDVLNYQWTKEQTLIGLSYIVLNGNLDLLSYEYEELNRLINEKIWRMEITNKSKVSADIEELFLSTSNNK